MGPGPELPGGDRGEGGRSLGAGLCAGLERWRVVGAGRSHGAGPGRALGAGMHRVWVGVRTRVARFAIVPITSHSVTNAPGDCCGNRYRKINSIRLTVFGQPLNDGWTWGLLRDPQKKAARDLSDVD